MTQSPERESEGVANIRRILVSPSPPKAAHMITWTRVGDQVLLEVGYFDLFAIHQKLMKREEQPSQPLAVEWLVTDRYILDFESAQRIAGVMAEMAKDLAEMREETNGPNS